MGFAKKIHLTFCYRYLGVLICLACGAAIFREVEWHKVERDPATQYIAKMNLNIELEKLHQTLSESLNMTIDLQLFHNITKRITNEQATVGKKRLWTWQQGVHFAFTIMSTIGYGDIAPKTNLGKALCILYGVITIPLYLLALSAAGDMKRFHIEKLLMLVERRLLKRTTIRRKKVKIIGITIFFFIVEMLIATGAARETQGWGIYDCFYFWFISTSSIGFGDYVPSYRSFPATFMFFLFFTLVMQSGLATIFSTLTEISNKPSAITDSKE